MPLDTFATAYSWHRLPLRWSATSCSRSAQTRFLQPRRHSALGSTEMSILSEQDVEQQLRKLQGWALEGRAIRKQFTFEDFPTAVAFVNRIVPDAQAADHHP